MNQPRNFSRKQKAALYLFAGGKCELCGTQLEEGWHADHKIPFSKGGETDVINGQALCPQCNTKKGNKMNYTVDEFPNGIVPRKWQKELMRSYDANDERTFFAHACPGAGKTLVAMMIASREIERGYIDQVIVVSNTDNIRNQWITSASLLEIELTLATRSSTTHSILYPEDDYIGLSITYHEVVNNTEEFRKMCSKHKTMVILDEVHHCGDSENKAWGPSVIGAFEHCEQILSLSGTPFRTDNNPIPFAKYVTKESSDRNFMVVDFDYGYGSALRDGGIVRDIIFPIYNSKVGWRTLNYGDQFYELSKVIKDKRSRALNIALSPTSDYVRGVLEEATIKLDTIRARGNHKDAGGLVIARDIADAKKIAKLLTDICEEPVAIVHSGDKDASSKIDSFRYSNKKWIVSVKMISEGVDIPRLRVGVYLSNIKTEVFFRQAIGRIIRWMDGVKMQTAFFFFPMMEPFITYMKDMAELVYDQYKHTEPKSQPGTGQGRHTQPELYTPIEGEITDMSEVRGTVQYSSDLMDAGVQAFQDRYPAIVDYIEILGRSTLTQIALDAGYTSEEIEFEVNVRDQGHKHHRSKHEIMADDRKRANKAVIALAFRMLDLGHFDNKDEAMKAMNDEYAQQNGYVSGASNHQYFLDKEAWALDRLRKLS